MNDKNDGHFDFLSDDDTDAFEAVPLEETPVNAVSTPVAPVPEPPVANNVTSESSAKTNSAAEKEPSNSQDIDDAAKEAEKRAIHEAEEAQRKAEFDARQAAKKQAEAEQIAKAQSMSDEDVIAAAIQRAGADTEKLTRRNMKEMVTEYVQTLCIEDPAFARLTMHPRKSMIRCFQYINRKAFEYVQDEMKANGQKPGAGMQIYSSDVPDDVCYQWAEDYFRDPTVKEDAEEEEKFTPKAYSGTASTSNKGKKASQKKKEDKKPGTDKVPEKPAKPTKDEQAAENGQISMFGGL